MVNPPASIIAQKRGMNVLADLPKLGLVYQHTAAATTKKYIREHRDIVRRYVKSQVEAVHRIYTDKDAPIRALARFIGRNVERDVLEKTWENILSEAVLPRKQYPSLEGLKTILASEPKGKSHNPKTFSMRVLSGNWIRAAISTASTRNVERSCRANAQSIITRLP